MKFKHHLVYDNSKEIEYMLDGGDYELSRLVVDTALENIKTRKKVIPIVSIYAQEEEMFWDLTLDREDIEETLNKNLSIMEKFEDYERCQEIVNGIKFIQNKKSNGNKCHTIESHQTIEVIYFLNGRKKKLEIVSLRLRLS